MSNFTFKFAADIHHHLPVLALDADDTLVDTRSWFTKVAVAAGANEAKCLACPTLSLGDDLIERKYQNTALQDATFMREAPLLPGAEYLLKALSYIEYPHFVLTHRGYHEDGQRLTEEFFAEHVPTATPQVVAVPSSVSKHEFMETYFSGLSGRGNYVLVDDNTHCRRPDAGGTIVHDRWSRTVVVSQPWNVDVAFGSTRVIHVESIIKVLLQELHVYAEVRGSTMAKNMYKKLWNYIRTSPYTVPEEHAPKRQQRIDLLANNQPVGVDVCY